MVGNVRNLYAYSVCLVTLIVGLIYFSSTLWNTIIIVSPEFTLKSYQFKCTQSNERYKQCLNAEYMGSTEQNKNNVPQIILDFEALNESEKKNMRKERLAQDISLHKREAQQELVKSLIVLVISLILFLAHFRIARNI